MWHTCNFQLCQNKCFVFSFPAATTSPYNSMATSILHWGHVLTEIPSSKPSKGQICNAGLYIDNGQLSLPHSASSRPLQHAAAVLATMTIPISLPVIRCLQLPVSRDPLLPSRSCCCWVAGFLLFFFFLPQAFCCCCSFLMGGSKDHVMKNWGVRHGKYSTISILC